MNYSVLDPITRPVLSREQMTALAKRIIGFTTAATARVGLMHRARVITHIANGRIMSGNDGDDMWLWIETKTGEKSGVLLGVNQIDDTVLRAAVRKCEELMAVSNRPTDATAIPMKVEQDTFLPVQLWHQETIAAMTTARETVLPDVIETVTRAGLVASGFLGFSAHAECTITKETIAFHEETDSELTITARTPDWKGTGWGGQATRNWATMRPAAVAEHAITIAQLSANPVAVEPGIRTAILGPGASAHLLRWMGEQLNAEESYLGNTGFSIKRNETKLHQRVFDERVSLRSDPNDPDGGYRPYFDYGSPYKSNATTWVEKGVLNHFFYPFNFAMQRGKPYDDTPYSIRLSGGPTSVEEMIAQSKEAIYVNRVSGVYPLDRRSGLLTGVTRDGCFLVKDGKIAKAVKDFRFRTSPFFFLNNLIALGPTARVALGSSPPGPYEGHIPWPHTPIIAPPMLVRDFNFNALADAI